MTVATVVDVVLAAFVVEFVLLARLGRRLERWPGMRPLLPNLAAGLLLVLALRAAIHGAGTASIGAFLLLAGVAHALDLLQRLR